MKTTTSYKKILSHSIAMISLLIITFFATVPLVLAQDPTLTLSPTSGPTGTVVTITGSGFTVNVLYRVYFDSNGDEKYVYPEPFKTVSANATGQFITSLTVPSVPSGTYYIRADVYPYTPPALASAPFAVKTLWDKLLDIQDEIAEIEYKLDGTVPSLVRKIDTTVTWVAWYTDEVEGLLKSTSYGLARLDTEIDAIEAKLDDPARWVSDADLASAVSTILTAISSARSAIIAEIDAIEGKLEAIEGKLDRDVSLWNVDTDTPKNSNVMWYGVYPRVHSGAYSVRLSDGDKVNEGGAILIDVSNLNVPLSGLTDDDIKFWVYFYSGAGNNPYVNLVLDNGRTLESIGSTNVTGPITDEVTQGYPSSDLWEQWKPYGGWYSSYAAQDPLINDTWTSDNPQTIATWASQFPGAKVVQVQILYGIWGSFGHRIYVDDVTFKGTSIPLEALGTLEEPTDYGP